MEGLPCRLRAQNHGLQSVQPLEHPGRLATDVRATGCGGRNPRRARHRLHSRQSPPLGARLQKKGDAIQAIGRSRGGRTSKIHALADDLGRPVAFTLTPGNIADISVARDLLETLAPPQRLLADKAYDADSLRDWLKARRVQAVIPSNATRRTPYPLDKTAYKRRNLIERMFCRLKDWRRIATRYDRTARNFLSALALAATISFWAN
jgi:transposase